jgi:uncharacterized damage-inducible protein DinB
MSQSPAYASLERFLDHWDGVRMVTLKLLHCFSDEDLRRTLWQGSRTVGEMFHHIGAHQFYAARGLFKNQWEPSGTLEEHPDSDWDLHKHLIVYKVETLAHWLKSVQARVRTWAEGISADRLWEFAKDNPWHEGMRGWLLLQHAYQDEIHHRGQLYLFARQLGHIPPDVFAVDYPEYWEERKWK